MRSKGLRGRKRPRVEFSAPTAGDLWRKEEERLLGSVLLNWGQWPLLSSIELRVDDFELGAKAWHGYIWQVLWTAICQRWTEQMVIDKLISDRETHADFGEARPALAVARLINSGLPDVMALVDSVRMASIARQRIDALSKTIEAIQSQMYTGLWRASRERDRAMLCAPDWPDPAEVLSSEADGDW